MIRPIIINDRVTASIAKVLAYAEQHRIDLHRLTKMLQTGERIGDDLNLRMTVPLGYICCFSIEQQKAGWCRHLSISIDEEHTSRVVSPAGAWMIAECYGFWGDLCECLIAPWFEDLPDKPRKALNLIQLYTKP